MAIPNDLRAPGEAREVPDAAHDSAAANLEAQIDFSAHKTDDDDGQGLS